jgi:hypothetical protein
MIHPNNMAQPTSRSLCTTKHYPTPELSPSTRPLLRTSQSISQPEYKPTRQVICLGNTRRRGRRRYNRHEITHKESYRQELHNTYFAKPGAITHTAIKKEHEAANASTLVMLHRLCVKHDTAALSLCPRPGPGAGNGNRGDRGGYKVPIDMTGGLGRTMDDIREDF